MKGAEGIGVTRESTQRDKKNPDDLSRFELETHVSLYKHHFDLFFKALILYLAVVGAVAGYVFRPEIDAMTRAALSLFAFLCSGLAIFGCRLAEAWGANTEVQMARLAQALGIPVIQLSPGQRFARLVRIFAILMCVTSILISAVALRTVFR